MGFFGFLVCGILFPIYCVKNYVIVKDYNNKIIWVYASSYYISIHVDEQIVAKDTTKSFSKAKLECMYAGLDIKVEQLK